MNENMNEDEIYIEDENIFVDGIMPFGCTYQHIKGNLNTRHVFSFSLFITTKFSQPDKIDAWKAKYYHGQFLKFRQLLEDPNWSDYGIIHFIDNALFKNILSLKDDLNYLSQDFPDRYKVIKYGLCPPYSEFFGSSEYFGTVIRFTAFLMPNLDSVLIRDAHSSMPNPRTRFDLEWRNHWYNNTNKQFWIYNMVNYNPPHNNFRPTMFAAAWGAKRMQNEQTIIHKDAWKKMFEDNIVYITPGYGIDERLLSYFIEKPGFLDNAFIVGVTHLIWLFCHKINERQHNITKEYKGPNLPPFTEKFTNLGMTPVILEHKIPPILSDFHVSETYFQEVGCLVKYLNQVLIDKERSSITINRLFFEVEEIQNFPEFDLDSKLLKKIYGMVPTRWHLWDFLFDSTTWGGINDTLDEYLNNAKMVCGVANNISVDLENQCDIVSKFFKGGKIFFDDYQYEKFGVHNPLSPDISLPNTYRNAPLNFQ